MFICGRCLEDCEGAPIEFGKRTIAVGMGSLGPCEFCGKVAVCADVKSYGAWTRKKKEE